MILKTPEGSKPADHHAVIKTALRRAGLTETPAWFYSYTLADVPLLTRRKIIAHTIERRHRTHGGILGVFLDGLADFTPDPNDPAEAFGFIDELHQLAIRYLTALFCIIHENPSGGELGKTRGHLGSQLTRKAETNLRLVKDGDVVTAFTDKSRHAQISKEHGPCFQWDHEQGMFVSILVAAKSKSNAKREETEELADEVYKGVPATIGLSWSEVHDAIGEKLQIKREGARRHFKAWKKMGLILKKGERWIRS